MPFFSNLLLLETKDWNKKGEYIPNIGSESSSIYDYFVLVRIKPDLKKTFKSKKLFYSDRIEFELIEEVLSELVWEYDVVGAISNETLKHIIKNNYILPKNSLLNGNTEMDAENYYIQCGNMFPLTRLLSVVQGV